MLVGHTLKYSVIIAVKQQNISYYNIISVLLYIVLLIIYVH